MVMHAVIRTGGKQYKVEKGDTLKIEKLDKEAGKSIKINAVSYTHLTLPTIYSV